MEIEGRDPRDVAWEQDRPGYRVHLWHRAADAAAGGQGWRSDEWRVSKVGDVRDVLAWAAAKAEGRRVEVLVEVATSAGLGVVRVAGIDPTGVRVRRATALDSDEAASVWWRAREASTSFIPAPVHSEDDVRAWFRDLLMPEREVWVGEIDGIVVAVSVIDEDWVDQFYVEPALTGWGIGSLLLVHAQAQRPDGLQLWTFEANTGARRFYERHGFAADERTAGDNEEGAPDIRYRWPGDAPADHHLQPPTTSTSLY